MIARCIPVLIASLGFLVNVKGTPLPTSTSSSQPLCSDSPLNVIQGGGVYGCHWITDLAFCEKQGVKSHCPVTCNACDEYACLDSVRGFIYEGQEGRCASLARLSTADLEMYCSYPEVSSTCRGSCDVCATPTPTLLPTPTPTLLPTTTPTLLPTTTPTLLPTTTPNYELCSIWGCDEDCKSIRPIERLPHDI
jgi:hypothetical protein